MFMKFRFAIALLFLPAMAEAADITGIAKIREGDQIQIGSARIRLAGIDAPSVDQLCLNTKGERWTCGVAARDELIRHVAGRLHRAVGLARPQQEDDDPGGRQTAGECPRDPAGVGLWTGRALAGM